jgi:hypothetical protein
MAVYPTILAGQKVTADLLTSMQPLHAAKTANTSRASTTAVTADPELQLSVTANAEYIFTFYLRIGGIQAGGIDIMMTTPSGASGSYSCTRLTADASADTGQTEETRSSTRITYNVETEFSPVSTSANQVLEGSGRLIMGSTAGTFSVDWAQNASNATATTMHSDSWISLRRIA